MENLGAMADSRYTGFREITDRDVLELHCSLMNCGCCNNSTIYQNDSSQLNHYENMPIQIYRKFYLQKLKLFS